MSGSGFTQAMVPVRAVGEGRGLGMKDVGGAGVTQRGGWQGGLRNGLLAVLLLWLLLQPLVAAASGDIGFRLRQGEFSVTVRYPFEQLAEADDPTQAEFGQTGGLMFDCLAWLYTQRANLSGVMGELVFWADLERHEFAVELDGQTLVEGLGWQPGEARRAVLGLMANVARISPLSTAVTDGEVVVPLAVVVYRDALVGPFAEPDSLFGALPGRPYSQHLGAYVDLYWQAPQGEAWRAALAAGSVWLREQPFSRESLGFLLGPID